MSRLDKVTEAIRQEASIIIHDELKDPRLGFVTVTRVEMTPDLRQAKIFYSVLGKDEDYKRTRDALESALGYIRRLIAERVQLRLAPEIMFREDRSAEHVFRIQQILDEINEQAKPAQVKEAGAARKSKRKVGRYGAKRGRRLPKK
jgi:ribosome-binding factor A